MKTLTRKPHPKPEQPDRTVGLRLDNVSTGYGSNRIIKDLDLSLAPGEVVGVLGSNGAGKTTLLRAIAGAVPTWSGRITLDGTDITKRSAWGRVHRGCAHVPEGRHVFTSLSVEENLLATVPGRGRKRANLSWPYELFPKLKVRRKQAAGSMSGGEQQMLAIARALMTQPTYLLIDEMSAGLAPLIVQGLTESLHEIAANGVGVLIVEQAPDYVLPIVNRLCLMVQGEIVREADSSAMSDASEIARSYLGVVSD
jgi:branched-chain amino acid transport system ATP-binding protein